MKQQFLEVGKITNVHGLMGEVRVQPWADSPIFLCQFKTLYVDKTHWPIRVERARVHKNMVILKLEGVTDVNSATAMRNAILYIDRKDVNLPRGQLFPGRCHGDGGAGRQDGRNSGQHRRRAHPPRQQRLCGPGRSPGDPDPRSG